MTKKRPAKPYEQMSPAELARANEEFEEEFVADTFTELTPEAQARWEKARRHPSSAANGPGAEVISVSVDRDLLARSDALAKKMGLTRAKLIARALKAVLAV